MANFDPVTLIGTEQRDYGVITGGCQINLERFAVVINDTNNPPDGTLDPGASVVYGKPSELFGYNPIDVMFKQCGYAYDGNFSLLFMTRSMADTKALSSFAIAEARNCKKSSRLIVIEAYGEATAPFNMALWFQAKVEKSYDSWASFPTAGSEFFVYLDGSTNTRYIWNGSSYIVGSGWEKLGSALAGAIMPYSTHTFTFMERLQKKQGAVEIACCRYCQTCECYNCNTTQFRMVAYVTNLTLTDTRGDHPTITKSDYGIRGDYVAQNKILNKYGAYSLIFQNGMFMEYTVSDNSIAVWGYTDSIYNDYITMFYNKIGTLNVGSSSYISPWNLGYDGDIIVISSGYYGPKDGASWPWHPHPEKNTWDGYIDHWYFNGNFYGLYTGTSDSPPFLWDNYTRGYLNIKNGNMWVGTGSNQWRYYYTIPYAYYETLFEGHEEAVCVRSKFKVITTTFKMSNTQKKLYGTGSTSIRRTVTNVQMADELVEDKSLTFGSVLINYALGADNVVSTFGVRTNGTLNEYVEIWIYNPISNTWLLNYEGWTDQLVHV